ncbi:MAG TPA: LysR substrate-binding domain-containing protein, partial [Kofleriaceae bacterium]|nr:LysR substrate-binding domain-containing protein [Kofleriaceae bacterium]
IVASFLDAYPGVRVELVLADRNLNLIEDEIDVALRIGPLADSSLIARRVGEVRHTLIASPSYLAGHRPPRTPGDLAHHDVIFTATRPGPLAWRFGGAPAGRVVRLVPRLVVNEVEAALLAARAGRGIARALSYQVADDLEAGALVRLLPRLEPAPLPGSWWFRARATCPRRRAASWITPPVRSPRCASFTPTTPATPSLRPPRRPPSHAVTSGPARCARGIARTCAGDANGRTRRPNCHGAPKMPVSRRFWSGAPRGFRARFGRCSPYQIGPCPGRSARCRRRHLTGRLTARVFAR